MSRVEKESSSRSREDEDDEDAAERGGDNRKDDTGVVLKRWISCPRCCYHPC